MPRVERDAEVTLVTLVYRSLRWLNFVMDGVERAATSTRYRWLVVANDPTPEVANDPRVGLVFTNENKDEHYIARVYRAWNAGVLEAPTQLVCCLNSDMYPSAGWLDELMYLKRMDKATVPCSLLVESGKVPSGMPEHVYDHGRNPDEFKRDGFLVHAETIKRPGGSEPGRLYMPILLDRQEFFDVGGYPEGNPPGTTGDKDLIRRYAEAGYQHVTALGSVVAHIQLGEQDWP